MHLIKKNGRQMENGVTIGKLLPLLRKIALNTPGREQFPVLDPVIGNLTDSSDMSWVHFNWGIIQRELRKFGADISNHVKEMLVNGEHEVIREVIKFLINFERVCHKDKKAFERNGGS